MGWLWNWYWPAPAGRRWDAKLSEFIGKALMTLFGLIIVFHFSDIVRWSSGGGMFAPGRIQRQLRGEVSPPEMAPEMAVADLTVSDCLDIEVYADRYVLFYLPKGKRVYIERFDQSAGLAIFSQDGQLRDILAPHENRGSLRWAVDSDLESAGLPYIVIQLQATKKCCIRITTNPDFLREGERRGFFLY